MAHDARMITCRLLVHGLVSAVLTHDNCKFTGWEEKSLISEQTVNALKGNRPAMTDKLRKSLPFCYAVGIPRHKNALRANRNPVGLSK
jgi:hypothetical protein